MASCMGGWTDKGARGLFVFALIVLGVQLCTQYLLLMEASAIIESRIGTSYFQVGGLYSNPGALTERVSRSFATRLTCLKDT